MLRLFVICLIVFCSAISCYSRDMFVNRSTGNDSWDGLASVWDGVHGPKDTIQSAIDYSSDGDIIQIAPGIYNEDIDMLNKLITLRSSDPDNFQVVLATTINGGDSAGIIASDGEIRGLTISSGKGIQCGTYSVDGTSPTIAQCVIDTKYRGITNYVPYHKGPTTPVIENNIIRSSLHGIKLDHQFYAYGGANAIIRNNIIIGPGTDRGFGLFIRMQKSYPIFENNIMMNWKYGITFTYNVDVANKLASMQYNCLWSNQVNCIVENPSPGTIIDVNGLNENITDDPLFADLDGPDNDISTWHDNDIHLIVDSPCINAGNPYFVQGSVFVDIDGQDRVRLGRVDIGVDEAETLTADINLDGKVDLTEFALISTIWQKTSADIMWNPACDISNPQDDVIDIQDIEQLAEHWLWQAPWAK